MISLPGPQPSGHTTLSCCPSYSSTNSCPSYTPSGTLTVTIVVMVVAMVSSQQPRHPGSEGGVATKQGKGVRGVKRGVCGGPFQD